MELVPLRSVRKKSIMPPPELKVNERDLLQLPDHSPQNSITSMNSISSLLKEKLAFSIPAMLRRKKPQQYKLKAFVSILFFCIVFLVGFAHVFYHQHVLQRAYFERIRFNNEERVVRIFSGDGEEILRGWLASWLGPAQVFHCLPEHEQPDGAVCMEWMGRARLYLRYAEMGAVRCYNVEWLALADGVHPTDCYDWSGRHGHWYGGGQTWDAPWPLETGTVHMAPFVTGGDLQQHPWGNVLHRYFINSHGVAISVDPKTPLHVSVNSGGDHQLCLQARHDDFAYAYHATTFPQLNYSVCTSSNMKTLHSVLSDKNLWDGLKESDLETVYALLSEPVWQLAPPTPGELTEAAVYNYTEDVIALGFLRQGHVLLNEFWQPQVGDLTLDPERFPTMQDTIDIIHRRGFRIVFTVQPFISTESQSFRDAVREGLLVCERGSDAIPALTRYRSVASAGVLDATNDRTAPWLQEKLRALIERYHVDAFYLDVGTAMDMPRHYHLQRQLPSPDDLATAFTDAVPQAIGVSSAVLRPRAPVFVSLPPFSSSWDALKAVIPTMLTYGIIGYPFVMPGAVGGDYAVLSGNASVPGLPDKELYIRWLQLATFLPVLRYTHLPSKYDSESGVLEVAKVLTALRHKTVNALLKKYVHEALDFGSPIVRPLWMLDPADAACHTLVDEFSIGEELIVAPVLYAGASEREVYLPAGVWKDGIDGSLRKGSRWLHNYRVPLDKVAYFLRMPDNTRF